LEDIRKENTGASDKPKVLIHRVCVTCNKMFTVDAEHYEEKQCPECHPHTPPPKK
jgi:hypothetical protein